MSKTVIQIEVDPPLLTAIDARAELAGLSREKVCFFDIQFLNLKYLKNAFELVEQSTPAAEREPAQH